jgi:hypothetical protein
MKDWPELRATCCGRLIDRCIFCKLFGVMGRDVIGIWAEEGLCPVHTVLEVGSVAGAVLARWRRGTVPLVGEVAFGATSDRDGLTTFRLVELPTIDCPVKSSRIPRRMLPQRVDTTALGGCTASCCRSATIIAVQRTSSSPRPLC